MWKQKLKEIVLLKSKFAASSVVATSADYSVYLLLTEVFKWYAPYANLLSQGIGMIINFVLQKRYVFLLNRKVSHAFFISIGSSLLGLLISTGLIYFMIKIPFFAEHQFITKGIVTGIIFFYNFYMKRFAFEKKFI